MLTKVFGSAVFGVEETTITVVVVVGLFKVMNYLEKFYIDYYI